MSREHELRVWPEYYAALVSGDKRYEFRHDDRGFLVGDTLYLREWDNVTREYTGRSMRRRIGWISDTLTSAVWGSGVILSLVDGASAEPWPPISDATIPWMQFALANADEKCEGRENATDEFSVKVLAFRQAYREVLAVLEYAHTHAQQARTGSDHE